MDTPTPNTPHRTRSGPLDAPLRPTSTGWLSQVALLLVCRVGGPPRQETSYPEEEIDKDDGAGHRPCVVIGGGISTHEPLLEFFEKVINMVRQHAPDAAIAFNGSPVDCADAALRLLR